MDTILNKEITEYLLENIQPNGNIKTKVFFTEGFSSLVIKLDGLSDHHKSQLVQLLNYDFNNESEVAIVKAL